MKEQLKQHLLQARWFGGKGREFEVVDVRRLGLPGSADPETTAPLGMVTVELVTVEYAQAPAGGASDRDVYQVPLSYYLGERPRLKHALVGVWDDDEVGQVWAYDAMHDHSATPLWLQAFKAGGPVGDLVFHRVGDPEIDVHARSTLMSAEQSNTSVVFGDDSLMKLFRRVTPGQNPDIEITAALTEAGNEHIAALYGWVETPDPAGGEVLQLGIIQQFLRTASDGWELALASLRNLYGDVYDQVATHAEDSGGDFASEAHRLGSSVADMHASLVQAFPTESWGADELGRLADDMLARLDAALTVVPQLEEHAAGLRAIFDSIRDHDRPVTAQRVHGDLHLGQTLRTVRNWKIIDFEGEPAKSLDERRLPDSPWRDVAGMLRSFSYAAELSRLDREQAVADDEGTVAEHAREWASRNRKAFLRGYQETCGIELDEALITAYAADKAVYEAVYEARNRPTWLRIPMAALAHLAGPT
jgi:maltokinase